MRVAYFSKRKKRTGTPEAIERALRRAGHEVLAVHEAKQARWLGRRFGGAATRRALRRFAPELVFVHNQDISEPVFDAVAGRARTVVFLDDCWPSPVRPEQLGLVARADLLLTVAKGQIEEFRAAGAGRTEWIAEAHDPEMHHPVAEVPPEWQSDVAFIGKTSRDGAHHATRNAVLRAVCERFDDVALYGRGWDTQGLRARRDDVYPEQYRLVCSGAKIVLGRDWRDDCAWYCSNRTWLTLGCGGFLLTNHAPGFEDLFENHGHLVWYRSPEECVELIRHYLARPDERRRIAQAGHRYALEHRTYDHFVRDLFDRVASRPLEFPPSRPAAQSEGASASPG